MKSDRYTRFILTVIAICLSLNVGLQLGLISPAYASKVIMENTETPWLRDLASGNMYLQLSGRWFRSKAADGPWVFVPADELPEAFVFANVAGQFLFSLGVF